MKHFIFAGMAFALTACGGFVPNDAASVRRDARLETRQPVAPKPTPAPSGTPVVKPQPVQTDAAKVDNDGNVQASPANPAPQIVKDPGANNEKISDEQDFDAVAGRQTIESDAKRLETNRGRYVVIQPTDLPARRGGTPNIVDYAVKTNNPVGTRLYKRLFGNKARSQRACAAYATSDLAQQAFLKRGGPVRDPKGLDPDGDGFACNWDPTPFRRAVQG